MKNLMILLVLATSITTVNAGRNYYNKGGYYSNKGGYYSNRGSSDDYMPKSIKSYLNENYGDHEVVVFKEKGNEYFFVKIRYNFKSHRPYYRSLVFDPSGRPVKG